MSPADPDLSKSHVSRFLAESDLAVSFADPAREDQPLIFVNNAFERLTGYARDECLERNCRFLQGGRTDPDAVRRVREGIAAERFQVTELLNYRRRGGAFENALLVGPIRRPDGSVERLFGMQWDLQETLRRRREGNDSQWWHRDFRRQLDRFEELVDRIAALSTQEGGASAGIEVVERLVAMSRPQQYPPTSRLPNWMQASSLLRYLTAPYMQMGTDSLTIGGDTQIIAADIAPPLALWVHELAARTLAIGEGVGRSSAVTLNCHVASHDGEPMIEVRWHARIGRTIRERPDREPDADESEMAGMDLVRDVVSGIDGHVVHEIGPRGIEALLALPNRPLRAPD